ncbi:MAG: hypothetical protein RLZZ308_476 [Candidatus Parcubacteria bacterium]
MKKIIALSFGLLVLSGVSIASASTYYYGSSYNHGTVCSQDAYQCPNGTWVGRTGSNCQFVCSGTSNNTYQQSYTYTSGCYTYYYNGQTRTTSVLRYTCGNGYYNNNNYSYTYPVTTSYPSTNYYTYTNPSSYYTYSYCNGSWTPSYYGSNSSNCNSIWDYLGNYTNSYSNANYGYNYNSYNYGYTPYQYGYNTYNYNTYSSGCYYLNGYQVCQ